MNYQVLGIPEKLDHENMAETREMIVSANNENDSVLVLDFQECEYMDSSGLGMLVHTTTDAALPVCLVGLKPNVRTLLKLTQVDKILNIFSNLDSALSELRPA